MGKRPFDFTVYAHSETFVVRAYEPFDEASFIAQRDRYDTHWLVVHRNTSMIVWHPVDRSLRVALEVAGYLSVHCAQAARVKLQSDAQGRPLAGHLSGPHRKVRNALKTMLPVASPEGARAA